MGWIKRHLFFVVGGLLAFLSLGGAGVFIYQNWAHNSDASEKLGEIYTTLHDLANAPQQPGNDKINNTELAKEQGKQIAQWMKDAGKYFVAIPAIPPTVPLTNSAYAEALRQTIDSLRHQAEVASVMLPPQYDFSFSAQRTRVVFAPGSLEPLAVQLGEVKAISEVLFAAKVNALDSIQRVRVSEDDATSGLQSDYIDQRPVTNDLAVITPYVVTFRTFTPELAKVMSGFATAPSPFIVKSVSVQPAGMALAVPDAAAQGNGNYGYPGGNPPPYGRNFPDQRLRGPMSEQPPPGAAPVVGKGGLQTVLKEQLLRITLEVEIVKLAPKS
jgi:hypothetical protein